MYCPKCATANIENARYCRSCGADIGLVAQALSGELTERRAVGHDAQGHPYDETGKRIHRHKDPPSLDKAIRSGCSGFAFLLVSAAVWRYAPGGRVWWFWMLIPAFTMLGGALAEYIRYKHSSDALEGAPTSETPAEIRPADPLTALPARNTAELVPPPSVTEGTTRHLDFAKKPAARSADESVE